MGSKKKVFALLIASIYSLLAFSMSSAATDETALTSLKKFRSKCEVGIAYRDYSNALSDVNYEVKEYLDTNEVKRNPELAKYITEALSHYVYAGKLWNTAVSDTYIRQTYRGIPPESQLWKTFLTAYPEANSLMHSIYSDEIKMTYTFATLEEMLSFIWQEAAKNIDGASALMASSPAKQPKKK